MSLQNFKGFLALSLLFFCLLFQPHFQLSAQGFEPQAQQYVVPVDGAVHGTVPLGFARYSNYSIYHTALGTHEWDTRDMDGDGLPDLVVTSEAVNGDAAVLDGTTLPHWMVYPGTTGGFSASAIVWQVPQGGYHSSTANLGIHFLNTVFASSIGQIGSQVWTTRDMDADGRPDLVVMSEKINSDPATYVYKNGNQAYGKVYLNTGNGFANNFIQWNVPDGGNLYNGSSVGFYIDRDASFSQQSHIEHQSWDMHDMDGDGKDDLVVMSLDGVCIGMPN